MATSNPRVIYRRHDYQNRVARMAEAVNPVPRCSLLVVSLDGRGSGGRQPAPPSSVGGAGRVDSIADERPGSGVWDRLVARLAGNRPPSPAVRDADAKLDEAVQRYNRVREVQGRPPVDLIDLMGADK